jgi:NADH:ubiquinone oxidoreductase subunit C
MSNDQVKELILSFAPDTVFDEASEFLTIPIEVVHFRKIAEALRQKGMDFLFCLTCVDWKTHLTVVYHLRATTDHNAVVLKVNVERANPEIETVCDIWRTAEFHEREVFEMFGVQFKNHPDLRRLILEDDFKGFPLRKDFEDPINMIKL